MSEAGESVVTLARWLGHSSPAITLGYYAHFMPEAVRGAAPSTVCSGSVGDQLAGRNSPDSPRHRRPAIPAPTPRRSRPRIVRLKRWVAWESVGRGRSDPLCHAFA
ncbi:hypothetical protein [Streptomyces nitrosporeus]|uniref:hypothetical protein n=1 Tax=Streptomyces nitrosporeus TaxID=28894 RepID=UPI00399FD686